MTEKSRIADKSGFWRAEEKKMERHPKRVMVISFDAVGSADLADMQKLPHFQSVLEDAALCRHVDSVYPSLTYPAHTSIMTGRMPKNHGVVNNIRLQPKREDPDWIYQRKYIKSPTLYSKAREKGMKTAGLLWPVIGRSGMDYYVPEIMVTRKWQNQILANALNGPIGYQLGLQRRFAHLRSGISQPELDDFITECALYTIRKYNPDLFFLHLTDVDTMRHQYGVHHEKAAEALRRHDKRLGRILKALEETGDMEETTVVLLGDHYQKDVNRAACLNYAFRKAGLLEVRNDRIKSWRAFAQNCDGSCYVYLNPRLSRKGAKDEAEAVKKRLLEVIHRLSEKENFGIAKVFTGKEAGKLGADPTCFLMLEAKEGWYFSDEFSQLIKKPEGAECHRAWGTHGFLPEGEEYQTFFAMNGCCVRPGIVEAEMALWDEGATLAALIGVDLGETDGHVIWEMLER